jgi:hypothetical protein
MKNEIQTRKKCEVCHLYVNPKTELCDECLLRKHGLDNSRTYDDLDEEGMVPLLYEDDVVKVLRLLEEKLK